MSLTNEIVKNKRRFEAKAEMTSTISEDHVYTCILQNSVLVFLLNTKEFRLALPTILGCLRTVVQKIPICLSEDCFVLPTDVQVSKLKDL